ncbi:MAG TPA: M28 family peptidase [Planctomycetota bacterium]|nr:M28 family peptidase [Planctomycetota bacterium]
MLQVCSRFALLCCFVAVTNSCTLAQRVDAPAPSSAAITASDLRRQVSTLASDAMQGRATGSPEAMEAARYLAAEMKRMGVEPAGESGTYFQSVPIGTETTFLEIPKLACVATDGAAPPSVAGVDFDLADGGCDLRALKIVYAASPAEIPRAPDAGAALVLLTDVAKERVEWLKTAGIPDAAGWGLLVALGAKTPGAKPIEHPPRPRLRKPVSTPRISVRGELRQAFVDRKVASLQYAAPVRTAEPEAVNVVGKITGVGTAADKGLAAEVIEFSAHYDHLPPRANVPDGQDPIFNGADDDASGCAVVLELAEAFAHEAKPARTLLFFFATGEEIGLVGSEYTLDHPIVPLEKIVLDLNFEMLGRPDPLVALPARMWLTGFERSDLGPELQRLGVPVVADMRPDQGFFQRSDNYSLAKRGIVAQTLSSFGLHTDYHQVSDSADKLDYEHMEACALGALNGSRGIASGSYRPRWHEGLDPSKPPKAKPDASGEKGDKPKSGGN